MSKDKVRKYRCCGLNTAHEHGWGSAIPADEVRVKHWHEYEAELKILQGQIDHLQTTNDRLARSNEELLELLKRK